MVRHANALLLTAALVLIAVLVALFQPRPAPEMSHARVARDENSALVMEDGSALIDLNRANRELLMTLPGIGEALAERIIRHRDEHGALDAVDQLLDVPGIGPAKLEAIRDRVTVTPAR